MTERPELELTAWAFLWGKMKLTKCLILVAIFSFLVTLPARAVTYPTCSTTPVGVTTDCTLGILVTSTATPVFARITTRTYLFIQNLGYTNDATPIISQLPVWCAIGTNNAPVAVGSTLNSFIIQPGSVYQPTQIVRGQSPFTVPPGDISCIAPLGNVWITAEQEGG